MSNLLALNPFHFSEGKFDTPGYDGAIVHTATQHASASGRDTLAVFASDEFDPKILQLITQLPPPPPARNHLLSSELAAHRDSLNTVIDTMHKNCLRGGFLVPATILDITPPDDILHGSWLTVVWAGDTTGVSLLDKRTDNFTERHVWGKPVPNETQGGRKRPNTINHALGDERFSNGMWLPGSVLRMHPEEEVVVVCSSDIHVQRPSEIPGCADLEPLDIARSIVSQIPREHMRDGGSSSFVAVLRSNAGKQ